MKNLYKAPYVEIIETLKDDFCDLKTTSTTGGVLLENYDMIVDPFDD